MQGTTWVYIMLGINIVYCFYWGLKGYFTEKTSSGYAIAGRSIPFVAFLMATTNETQIERADKETMIAVKET
jgi:Na+/proline symporter